MSASDAYDRAGRIWGRHRVISAAARPDGGFDIHLLQARGLASDTRGRNYSYHRLDEAGAPVCHDDCRALAAQKEEEKP